MALEIQCIPHNDKVFIFIHQSHINTQYYVDIGKYSEIKLLVVNCMENLKNKRSRFKKINELWINFRENQRGNQEWAIQRQWQHWVHKTQDEDKQNKKHNTAN